MKSISILVIVCIGAALGDGKGEKAARIARALNSIGANGVVSFLNLLSNYTHICM